jgi:hypothetical protein
VEEKRYLNRKAAAAYLDMSLNSFDKHVRPHVPFIQKTGTHKWDARDLDRLMEDLKVEPDAPFLD